MDGTLGEDSNTTRFDLRHNEARVVFRDHARAYRAVDAELDLRCAGMGVWRVNGAAIEESNGWKIYSVNLTCGADECLPMAAPLPTTAGNVAALAVTIFPPAPTAALAAGSKKLNTN